MIIALPVISFLSFALLCLSLLGPRVRSDIPQLSLVVWLIIGNLIHGINSLVWSGNTDIHVPVWCDIVTKVLLAVAFALPASCFCMAAHLELVASNRPYVDTVPARRARMIFNVIICWVVPVIYSLLHFLVQNHRFDIIKDFGCTAAIHSSTASVLVVWLPPFLFCVLSFIFSGLSIHRSFQVSASRFEEHIHNRLGMSSSLYLRQTISVLILTLAVTTLSVFTLFARTDFRSFASWDVIHAQFTKIIVLGDSPDRKVALMKWWLTPVVSLAYVFLWFLAGQDVRDAVKAFREGTYTFRFPSLPRPRFPQPRSILPTHFRKPRGTKPPAAYRPRPVAPVLVSGWDEMLDMHASKSPSTSASTSPSSSPSKSPRPSITKVPHLDLAPERVSEESEEEEGNFATATMEYLGSPTAHALGLNSPLSSPLPVFTPPVSRDTDKLLVPHDPFSRTPAITKTIPDDVASTVSSIYEIPWPAPPSTVPRVQPIIPKRPPRPQSPAFSDISFGGSIPGRRSMTPPNLRSPPFSRSGSGVSSVPVPDATSEDSYRTKLERLHQNLGLSVDVPRVRRKPSADVIYMTVVTHETS